MSVERPDLPSDAELAEFTQVFEERANRVVDYSKNVIEKRLDDHKAFVEEKLEAGDDFKYEAENYDFPVTTKQEKPLNFYHAKIYKFRV